MCDYIKTRIQKKSRRTFHWATWKPLADSREQKSNEIISTDVPWGEAMHFPVKGLYRTTFSSCNGTVGRKKEEMIKKSSSSHISIDSIILRIAVKGHVTFMLHNGK